jgi:hypothetical protein
LPFHISRAQEAENAPDPMTRTGFGHVQISYKVIDTAGDDAADQPTPNCYHWLAAIAPSRSPGDEDRTAMV